MLFSLTLSVLALAQAPQQFPGFVTVPGGKTTIGAEIDTAIERIIERPDESDLYAGECPRQSQLVDSFFISPTLVTNEMYLAFVKSTGATPPPLWALIDSEQRKKIITEGIELEGLSYKFDEDTQAIWWKEHWQDEGQEWQMPPMAALEPVVFVSFEQAQEYCRWAGVRMPTENEWVRAARGDTANEYPFGDEFNRSIVGYVATKPSSFAVKRLPVGMFPENASPYGILDMSGQVHEFTDTADKKLKGFKPFEVTIEGKKKSDNKVLYPAPVWDQSRIILKGGSYMNPSVNCRIDSRIGFSRESAVPVVGFRIAASKQPCRDAAYSSAPLLKSSIIGGNAQNKLNFARTIGVEKHSWSDLSAAEANREAPKKPLVMPTLPQEYAILNQYAGMSITPLKDPFATGSHPPISKIEKEATKDGHLYAIGSITTTTFLKGIDIEPGAYTLAFLPALKDKTLIKMGAKIKGKKDEGESSIELEALYDISGLALTAKKEHILIVNNAGVALAAIQLNKPAKLKSEKSAKHGFTFDEKKSELDFHLSIPGSRGKVYWLQFSMSLVDEKGNDLSNLSNWTKTSYQL